jgi:uncharacterized protein involved in exopolysaccharide biosynthesis
MFQDPKSFSPHVALPRDAVVPMPEPKQPAPAKLAPVDEAKGATADAKTTRSIDPKITELKPALPPIKPVPSVEPKPAAPSPATPLMRRIGDVAPRELFGFDLGFLFDRKRWIVMSIAAGLALALAYNVLASPRYRATTQLLISPADLRVLEKSSVVQTAPSPDATVLQVESETRVLTSDKVLLRVVDSEKLTSDPEFGAASSSWLSMLLSTRMAAVDTYKTTTTPQELVALRELQRAVVAKRTERTYVVDLLVTSKDAQKSARIANAIAAAYMDEQAASRMEAARRVTESLSSRLAELKERVRRAEEAVEVFKSKNDIVRASGRLVSEQQLADLNTQLTAAKARTEEAKARYDRSLQRGGDAGSTSEAVQSNTIGRLREQHAAVARQEAMLAAELGPRHPSVIEARAQVRNAERLIADEISRLAAANRLDYERARANETALNNSLTTLKQRAGETNMAFVKLRELEREVEASRAVYEAFLVRARETREQERLDSANVRVLSDAQPPRDRSWPPRLVILLLAGLMIGILGGVGTAWAAEQMRRARRTATASK